MEKAKGTEKWYKSKTKVGAVLVGVSAVLGTVGAFLQGQVSMVSALNQLLVEVGAVLGVMGIRDLPFVNKK